MSQGPLKLLARLARSPVLWAVALYPASVLLADLSQVPVPFMVAILSVLAILSHIAIRKSRNG